MDQITSKLHKLIVEKLGISEHHILDDASFTKDYEIHSLDLFEFIIKVEKHLILPLQMKQLRK